MRKEVSATITFEKTPSRADMIKALADKFSTSEENVRIKGIKGNFGSKKFNVEANVYSDTKERHLVELKKKKDSKEAKK